MQLFTSAKDAVHKQAKDSQVITEFLQHGVCLTKWCVSLANHCLCSPLRSIVLYINKNVLEKNVFLFYWAQAFSVHSCLDANEASKPHPNQNQFPCCYGMRDNAANQNEKEKGEKRRLSPSVLVRCPRLTVAQKLRKAKESTCHRKVSSRPPMKQLHIYILPFMWNLGDENLFIVCKASTVLQKWLSDCCQQALLLHWVPSFPRDLTG